MSTCKNCGKSGLFLKINSNGLCSDCQKITGLNDNRKTSPMDGGAAKLSIAELELLSKFMRVTTTDSHETSNYGRQWEEVSKKSIRKTIQKFINEKFIVPADLYQQLDYAFKVTELKEMCKKRGLNSSGKKEELISRLVTADDMNMKLINKGKDIVICSEIGRKLAQDYLDYRQNESDTAKGAIINALKKRDFRLASRTLINYEVNQFFQRGLNIDWKEEKEESYIPTLSYIFSKTPTVLIDIPNGEIELLRLVSGLNYLWGKNDWSMVENVGNISPRYDNITCAELLDSYSRNLLSLEEYKSLAEETRSKNYKVEIYTCNDEHVCPECEKLAKKKYPLFGEIPELPHINCKNGCRCYYSLDLGI